MKTVERTDRQNKKTERHRQVRAVNNRQSDCQPAYEDRYRRVPTTFTRTVRMPTVQLLCDESRHVRQRCEQRHGKIAFPRKSLQNGRKPECYPVASTHSAEITYRQQDYIAVAKPLPHTVRATPDLGFLLPLKFGSNPDFFVGRKPVGLLRPVG